VTTSGSPRCCPAWSGRHDWLQFQIDEHTFWGILHGDNSGYYHAFRIMAHLLDRFGHGERARLWEERAEGLRERLNAFCWNGSFYTHFAKLGDFAVPGVDETAQLSLSNPMDINRGAATHEMAVSILEEYRRRRESTAAFAEWFSIDPPFPDGVFGDEKLVGGAYVNGGIMPLVGGELALAAFQHGFEAYGVDILKRYHTLVALREESFLWYFPDGTPASVEASTSPDALPTDGWGSSAMLMALLTGLAGIEDRGRCFDAVALSPRWPAAGVETVDAGVRYASSGAGFGYDYRRAADGVEMTIRASASAVDVHLMLPSGARPSAAKVGGADVTFRTSVVRQSDYVDFSCHVSGETRVEVLFE
jgi:hypothetical protein